MRIVLEKKVIDKYFRIFFSISAFLLLASCIFFVPAFRNLIISAAEKGLGRSLTRSVWHERMIHTETIAFVFLSVFSLYFFLFRKARFSEDKASFSFCGFSSLFSRLRQLFSARKFRLIPIVIVFAICSVFRFYWMNQKTGFHEDELYSIGICNRNSGVYGFWGRELETGRAYKGAEITGSAYFDSASLLDVANDVAHLWVNTKDSPHPNLYYIFLRVWFALKKTSDFKSIFIRASLLNYVFFIASFIIFIRLTLIYTKNILAVSLLALIAFCNPASIGLSVFIRPYAMQETAFISFAYLFALYCSLLKNGTKDFSLSLHVKSVLVLAFLLSAGYFCTFYAAILGLCLVLFFAAKKDWNNIIYFLSMFFGAVIVSKIVYLYYGVGFFEGRGTEAVSKLSDRMINLRIGTETTINLISRNLFGFRYFVCTIFLGILPAAFFRLSGKRDNESFVSQDIIAVAAVLFSLVVMFFAPVKLLRYIGAVFPLLALAFAPCSRNKKITAVFLIIEVFAAYLNVKNSFPSARFGNARNIEHLDDSDPKSANPEYNKHPEIPVFVKSDFYAAFVVPYFNDAQTYILVANEGAAADSAKEYGFGEYYFIDYQFETGFSEKLIQNHYNEQNGENSK